MKVSALDEMSETNAREILVDCCGSSKWVSAMLQKRPFRSHARLHSAAEEVWPQLSREDWLEAFAHHPRIGERHSAQAQGSRGAAWSAGEQRASQLASAAKFEDELVAMNHEYEDRFGHIYIVCATGRTREEMLEIARTRLQNDPETELVVAAREQMAITRLRLGKLIDEDDTL